jgi:hypothetical protein
VELSILAASQAAAQAHRWSSLRLRGGISSLISMDVMGVVENTGRILWRHWF